MKSKETGMSLKELAMIKLKYVEEVGENRPDIKAYVDAALKRQAEIYFKAGRDSIVDKENLNYKRGFQSALSMMQSKLKEWQTLKEEK